MLESKEIGYNKGNTIGVPAESETDMSYNPLIQELHEAQKPLHSEDPILEKDSHIFGWVRIYPPTATDMATWNDLSWKVCSEKSSDGAGLNVLIKAKYVHRVFERPHFISPYMIFGADDIKEYAPEVEETWSIETPDRTIEKKDFTFED